MTEKQFQDSRQNFYEERTKILNAKGVEYAGEMDRLGNFRRGQENVGVLSETICFIYMQKHFDAIAAYVNARQQGQILRSEESIKSRLMDLANYIEFLHAIIEDSRQYGIGRCVGVNMEAKDVR